MAVPTRPSSSRPPPSPVGKCYAPPTMKDYILTEKLGQGSYAIVYKGFKKGNVREIVAVKCIKKSSLSKTSTENLLREIEILKNLDHPHIVKLKDFQWDDDNIFLILEYCSGGDLSAYIKQYRRLPEQIARKFLRQLAMALSYIRERNISHMDLKPQNLLIESKRNFILKVGDFGFAQHLLGKEGRDNLRGSPLYMAVEMFNSDSYDASVDLWSTGVILHETLFGFAPFASKTFEELERKIRKETINIPTNPQISRQCHDLLTRLLERDPKKRISFDDFFAHPYVDLEHTPGPECWSKGVAIVTKAIKFDRSGDYKDASELYFSALEYFIPAIEYEKDHKKKAAIRLKIKQYISRAEQIKLLQKQNTNRKPKLNRSLSIEECVQRLPGLSDALRHADNGDRFDDNKQYDKALEEYYKAIELIMPVLANVPNTSRTHATVSQKAEKMVSRAEELTRYRDIFAKGNDALTETSNTGSNHNCSIQ